MIWAIPLAGVMLMTPASLGKTSCLPQVIQRRCDLSIENSADDSVLRWVTPDLIDEIYVGTSSERRRYRRMKQRLRGLRP